MITLTFELKNKKAGANFKIEGSSPAEAVKLYLDTVEEWNNKVGTAEPAASEPKTTKKSTPESGSVTQITAGTKRQNADALNNLNANCLEWARKAILIIPDLSGLAELDLMKRFSPKEPALMTGAELSNLLASLMNVVKTYAQANTDASSYLEIMDLLESAENGADLEEKKNTFKRWKELSPNATLFQNARKYYEDKKATFEAAESISA